MRIEGSTFDELLIMELSCLLRYSNLVVRARQNHEVFTIDEMAKLDYRQVFR